MLSELPLAASDGRAARVNSRGNDSVNGVLVPSLRSHLQLPATALREHWSISLCENSLLAV